jgi:hypothetical protein
MRIILPILSYYQIHFHISGETQSTHRVQGISSNCRRQTIMEECFQSGHIRK